MKKLGWLIGSLLVLYLASFLYKPVYNYLIQFPEKLLFTIPVILFAALISLPLFVKRYCPQCGELMKPWNKKLRCWKCGFSDTSKALRVKPRMHKATERQELSRTNRSDNLGKTVQKHLDRVRQNLAETRMHEILDEVQELFHERIQEIESMVEETARDNQLHTKAIGGGGVTTWLIVSSIPRNRNMAKDFFKSEYPPGYGGYVNYWLNTNAASMAKNMGHSVMAQLLVYSDRSVGLGLCSLDTSNPLDACPKWLFPEESLTSEDIALFGM